MFKPNLWLAKSVSYMFTVSQKMVSGKLRPQEDLTFPTEYKRQIFHMKSKQI